MPSGYITKFDKARGTGIILRSDNGQEIPFHQFDAEDPDGLEESLFVLFDASEPLAREVRSPGGADIRPTC